MTSAPEFLVVSEHTARNPVARAVARARITQAVRDFLLRLYLLPDDAEVQADADAAAHVLAVALAVCDATGRTSSPEARVMQGGMGALTDLGRRRWHWRGTDAVALDQALQRALAVYRSASADQVQHAHRRVARLQAAGAARAAIVRAEPPTTTDATTERPA